MKIRVLLAAGICLLAFVAVNAADNETGISGKWLTDAVRTAVPDTKTGSFTTKILQSAGGVAAQQVPTGRRGPGGPGGMGSRGGGLQIDPSPAVVVEKGSSPDGDALILELKVSKDKLTGKVTEVVSGAKFDVEDSSVMAAKFQFTTYKKVASVKVATVYKGELLDETTISVTRWTSSGKPVDVKADGSPEPLIFRRSK